MGDSDLDRTLMALLAGEPDDPAPERAAAPSLDQRVEMLLRAVHGPDAAFTPEMRKAARNHLLAAMADDLAAEGATLEAREPTFASLHAAAETPARSSAAAAAPLWSGLSRSLQRLAAVAGSIFTVPRMRMVAVPLVALLIVGSIWTKDWIGQRGSGIENGSGNGGTDNGSQTRSLTPSSQQVDSAREQELKQKIAAQEAAHGPDDPGLARTLVDLAVLYRSTGRYEAAEGLCKRALAIQQGALGPKDPDTIRTLKELATIYRLEGRSHDADDILTKLEQ